MSPSQLTCVRKERLCKLSNRLADIHMLPIAERCVYRKGVKSSRAENTSLCPYQTEIKWTITSSASTSSSQAHDIFDSDDEEEEATGKKRRVAKEVTAVRKRTAIWPDPWSSGKTCRKFGLPYWTAHNESQEMRKDIACQKIMETRKMVHWSWVFRSWRGFHWCNRKGSFIWNICHGADSIFLPMVMNTYFASVFTRDSDAQMWEKNLRKLMLY